MGTPYLGLQSRTVFFFVDNWLLEHFLALFLSHIRPVRLQVASQVLHDWLPVIRKPSCHSRLEIRDFYIRKRRRRSDSSLEFFGIICKFLTKVAKLFIKQDSKVCQGILECKLRKALRVAFCVFFNTVELFHLFIATTFGTRLLCPWISN